MAVRITFGGLMAFRITFGGLVAFSNDFCWTDLASFVCVLSPYLPIRRIILEGPFYLRSNIGSIVLRVALRQSSLGRQPLRVFPGHHARRIHRVIGLARTSTGSPGRRPSCD